MIGVPEKTNGIAGGTLPSAGQTGWRSHLPTILPPRRRVKNAESKEQSVASILFNTFLVVSALLLTFVVLVREEEYALARPDDPAPAAAETPQAAPSISEQMLQIPPG